MPLISILARTGYYRENQEVRLLYNLYSVPSELQLFITVLYEKSRPGKAGSNQPLFCKLCMIPLGVRQHFPCDSNF
jgi:hypothetical protein